MAMRPEDRAIQSEAAECAFSSLQQFMEKADESFDQMAVERASIIAALKRSLQDSGHLVNDGGDEVQDDDDDDMPWEIFGETMPEEAAPDEAMHQEPPAEQVPSDGDSGETVRRLMQKHPSFVQIALTMATKPRDIDWNRPEVIQIEKALIFELGITRKMRDRGPPGPNAGGPQQWRGQVWRSTTERWGTRGGKSVRLAHFQKTLGKAKGKQAFVEDQAKRDAAEAAKGKGEQVHKTKPVTMGQALPGTDKCNVRKPVKVPPRFPNKVIGDVPTSQGASSSQGIAARPAQLDLDQLL